MNTKHLMTIVAATAFAMLAQTSFAQASAPASGALTPAGQGIARSAPKTNESDTTRANVKTDTRHAEKAGEIAPAGEHVSPNSEKK